MVGREALRQKRRRPCPSKAAEKPAPNGALDRLASISVLLGAVKEQCAGLDHREGRSAAEDLSAGLARSSAACSSRTAWLTREAKLPVNRGALWSRRCRKQAEIFRYPGPVLAKVDRASKSHAAGVWVQMVRAGHSARSSSCWEPRVAFHPPLGSIHPFDFGAVLRRCTGGGRVWRALQYPCSPALSWSLAFWGLLPALQATAAAGGYRQKLQRGKMPVRPPQKQVEAERASCGTVTSSGIDPTTFPQSSSPWRPRAGD